MKDRIMFQGTDVTEVFDYYNKQDEHKKHLKGYIYDSLVYRYQLARYKASFKDAKDIYERGDRNISREEAEAEARFNCDRDLMRFCQILNEAIGEHD